MGGEIVDMTELVTNEDDFLKEYNATLKELVREQVKGNGINLKQTEVHAADDVVDVSDLTAINALKSKNRKLEQKLELNEGDIALYKEKAFANHTVEIEVKDANGDPIPDFEGERLRGGVVKNKTSKEINELAALKEYNATLKEILQERGVSKAELKDYKPEHDAGKTVETSDISGDGKSFQFTDPKGVINQIVKSGLNLSEAKEIWLALQAENHIINDRNMAKGMVLHIPDGINLSPQATTALAKLSNGYDIV